MDSPAALTVLFRKGAEANAPALRARLQGLLNERLAEQRSQGIASVRFFDGFVFVAIHAARIEEHTKEFKAFCDVLESLPRDRDVYIDLAAVEHLSTLGLGQFIKVAKQMDPGCTISFCNPEQRVLETLQKLRLYRVLNIFPNEQSPRQ